MESSKGSRVINTVFMLLGITSMLLTLYDRFYSKKRRSRTKGEDDSESVV